MKFIDRAIDYVANRVLDRVEERKPRMYVTNNISGVPPGSSALDLASGEVTHTPGKWHAKLAAGIAGQRP